jgi:hypothetical protein
MEIVDFRDIEDFDNCNIYLKGDDHIGNLAVSYSSLNKLIKIINDDPIARWGNMGDGLECIYVGDRRFQLDIHGGKYERFLEQAKYWMELHRPIIPMMLFYLDGNHEEKLYHILKPGEFIADMIKREFGVKVIAPGRTIKGIFTDHFRLYATHGSGTVQSRAGDPDQIDLNESLWIKRKLRHSAGDCNVMAMGHIHKLRVRPPSTRQFLHGEKKIEQRYEDQFVNRGLIHEDSRWYCSTGSVLRTFILGATTYSEKAMYPPTELGMIRLVVKGGRLKDVQKVTLPAK